MARPNKLNNLEEVREIIKEYKNDPTPTLAGLTRVLGLFSYSTLLIYMDKDDEIADLIKEGYVHCVECHEKKLYDKSAVGSIFWLKTLRYKNLGFIFKDGESDAPSNQPIQIEFKVKE